MEAVTCVWMLGVFFKHSYLVLIGVPVMQQACWDEEGVVLVAALAVVPTTVVAHLGLSFGQTHWTLTT